MKMTFDVTYDDGRKVTTSAKPKDFVAYERQYARSVVKMEQELTLEGIYYLAWSSLHRTRQEPADFDGFLDIVEDVEPIDDGAADPSQPAVTPEPSAP